MKSDEKLPVRIGMVGCGRATTVLHLPALQFVPGAKVVALADPNPEALHRASLQLAVEQCVSDYRALLENRTIEAIAICAPVEFHVEIALAALDAGKHLFIEKPLSLTLEECDRLIERAAGLPFQIMLGFNTRWHRLTRQARTLFQQGAVGPLEIVRSNLLTNYNQDLPDWRKRRISGGGVLLEMAMHHFDLWKYVLDEEVEHTVGREPGRMSRRRLPLAWVAAPLLRRHSPNVQLKRTVWRFMDEMDRSGLTFIVLTGCKLPPHPKIRGISKHESEV